jgi:hypothetical protein
MGLNIILLTAGEIYTGPLDRVHQETRWSLSWMAEVPCLNLFYESDLSGITFASKIHIRRTNQVEADDLLEINCNMFKEMKRLAEIQEKLVGEDQMDKYLELVNKRERLKGDISKNNKRYNSLVKKGPAENAKRKNIAGEITEVIKSIQELDKRIEDLILQDKKRLISDISRIRKGRKSVRSYRRKTENIPRFIERKG